MLSMQAAITQHAVRKESTGFHSLRQFHAVYLRHHTRLPERQQVISSRELISIPSRDK